MSQVFLFALFFLFAFPAQATDFSGKKTEVSTPLVEPSQQIPLGEHLVYDVSWFGIHVGYGELEVRERTELNGRPVYHVVATARTNEFLSKIYPVEDVVHSWIDAETFQSVQFEKKVSEGFYRAHERVIYDEAKRKGYYESLKNGTKKEFDVSVPVHDAIGVFYWVRRQTLQPGKPLATTVNNGEKDYGLEVDVLRREQKELRGRGVIDTLLVEPKTRYQGLLDKRGRVRVSLKNDASRTPVVVAFQTPFGPIVGVLSLTQ